MRPAQVTPHEGGTSGSAPISPSGEIKYKSPLGGLQTADPLLGSGQGRILQFVKAGR
jgi:hypothetical protein